MSHTNQMPQIICGTSARARTLFHPLPQTARNRIRLKLESAQFLGVS